MWRGLARFGMAVMVCRARVRSVLARYGPAGEVCHGNVRIGKVCFCENIWYNILRLRMGGRVKVRGVNLGNWLVLEKWMGDSPLSESEISKDDHDLVNEYANDPDLLYEKLEAFRSSYVTRNTIVWLKEQGCNLVRVPIPYHICGSEHHKSCSKHLNNLFDWCDELGIGVLIDLHTVQYSQNGTDNGGYVGMCAWHQSADRVERTLGLLERLARRYADRPSLWGISPLNEPATKKMVEGQIKKGGNPLSSAPSRKFLFQYYEDFTKMLTTVSGGEVWSVLHDHYYLPAWNGFMSGYSNVLMDTHKYAGIMWYTRNGSIEKLEQTVEGYADEIAKCSACHPVIVGEWSLANNAGDLKNLEGADRDRWYREYADFQMDAWDVSLGGCFWSLRTSFGGGWSFEDSVAKGRIDLRHGI